jgi:DNA-binding PadR family transcriptional regulator
MFYIIEEMSRTVDDGLLSRTEEMLLLVVWELRHEAYGVSIRRKVSELTGRRHSVGAVYVPLERLVRQGLLKAEEGEPTPVRGGRRKRYYRLTARGVRALQQTRRVTDRLWAGKVRWKASRA